MTTISDILSLATFKRTYARKKGKSNQTESFEEAIDRIIWGCKNQLDMGMTEAEEQMLKSMFMKKKISVAGRFLWQLGTETVEQKGLMSLQNCAAIVIDDPVRNYQDMFEMLMLGCGVGFRITDDVTQNIPTVKRASIQHERTKDADFIVPDSREGWKKLMGKVLKAHFMARGDEEASFSYSTILLREKGEEIKTFGGVSAGYKCLVEGIVELNRLLNRNAGKKPSQEVLLDIATIIASIVISGNVRRSALLAVGDVHDEGFVKAKDWQSGVVPNWRCYSNNSFICNDIKALPESYWESFEKEGEVYGLLNIDLMRKVGRVGDDRYPDPNVQLTNPCVEITLDNYETCCLAEVFLPRIESYGELMKCVIGLYRICKNSLALPCHIKKTEEIIHENMRMGIGITGYLESSEEQKSWLSECYEALRTFDKAYSKAMNFPESIKLTTVKPSGTLSIIGGLVSSGIHPVYAKYFIRRVRFQTENPIVLGLKKMGFHWEYVSAFDGSVDRTTVVVDFPMSAPEGAVLAKDISAVQQLEVVKRVQREWSDNSVSVTVYYKKEEIPELRKWLEENYNDEIKSVSFLLHQEHGFKQAPLEEITKEKYEDMIRKIDLSERERIDFEKYFCGGEKELELQAQTECANGVCPLR
jgi:ribonucleoside-triphosphate reductase